LERDRKMQGIQGAQRVLWIARDQVCRLIEARILDRIEL